MMNIRGARKSLLNNNNNNNKSRDRRLWRRDFNINELAAVESSHVETNNNNKNNNNNNINNNNNSNNNYYYYYSFRDITLGIVMKINSLTPETQLFFCNVSTPLPESSSGIMTLYKYDCWVM